jgi:serine/threonine-protein kinase
MRPSVGLAVGERYRLTRRIAVGGMGEVWVADDTYLARDVAVKVLREEYTGNEDFLKRLRTEARNSAALSHPNIAQMYDYGEQDGAGYLVMELVLGEPLADLLEREPVIAPRKLLPILAATARGLHHAHLAQVVHRDVKPGNILIEHNGRGVKITDFGVSLAANQAPMTATGMVMGTAQYLSPEQAVGQPATAASDVYGLGIVAYEATAGKRPFTGKTPVDIAVAHVNSTVPPLPSTVHPGLSELILRALEKDPARRPASAADFADELEDLAREIAVDPLGARSRAARRAQATTSRSSRPRPGAAAGSGRSTSSAAPSPGSSTRSATQSASRSSSRPSHASTAPRPAPKSGEPVGEQGTAPVTSKRPASFAPAAGAPARDAHAQVAGRPDPQPVPGEGGTHGYATRREARAASGPEPRRSADRRTDPAGAGSGRRADRKQERTSTTTGQRLGPLGKLSWPLVALLGLLVVLLVATLLRGGFDGDSGAAPASPDLETPRPVSVIAAGDSGMMLHEASRARHATTIEKDV